MSDWSWYERIVVALAGVALLVTYLLADGPWQNRLAFGFLAVTAVFVLDTVRMLVWWD